MTVDALRPPRHFNYRDSSPPPLFDSSPGSSSRLSSYLNSYSRHESFSDGETPFFNEEAPSNYHRGASHYYDSPSSSYFPSHKSSYRSSSYHKLPLNFGAVKSYFEEYRGPPPPASSENSKHQLALSVRDERPNNLAGLRLSLLQEEKNHPELNVVQQKQSLSYGEHGNHLNFGEQGLSFASENAVTPSDINPVGAAEITSTTKSATTATATPPISVHSSSASTSTSNAARETSPSGNSEIQISLQQQRPATNFPNTETPTSASAVAATPVPKIASIAPMQLSESPSANTAPATASNTGTEMVDQEYSTPSTTTNIMSVTPKSNFNAAQNNVNNKAPIVSMMFYETPKMSYEFRTVSQDDSPNLHRPLSMDQSRLQVQPLQQMQQLQSMHQMSPNLKQNFVVYETKNQLEPYFQYNQVQAQVQHQQNSNKDIAPLRFSIPTEPHAATLSSATSAPVKLAFPSFDFARTPLMVTTVPFTNNLGQNQISLGNFGNLQKPVVQAAPTMPIIYLLGNNEQTKPLAQINSGIPLGSFVMLNNNAGVKQTFPAQSLNSGLQLQLGGLGGIDYLTSTSNSEPMKPALLETGKVSLSLQEPFRSPEPNYQKLGFGQGIW
ncbi:mucin-16-like [Trichogramma pretiosum]|uniref:mucin-16-like n=1 Tax=Trichogramma pretiosum TaxID=7493 RepID=UPI0006C9DA3A|nr:mucin-16-like [Trichogramma pretiosum]